MAGELCQSLTHTSLVCVGLWKSFEQTDLFLESLKKWIGKLRTAMLLTPKLFVTWIGDQTPKMRLGNSFNEQAKVRENSLEKTTNSQSFSKKMDS